MVFIISAVLAFAFAMPSHIVNGEETVVSTTLLTGREINEVIKKLAGDSMPEDQSVSSLYLVKDTLITGIEHAKEMNTNYSVISISSDGKTVAWLEGSIIEWYSEASVVYMNEDSSYLFYNLTSLAGFDGFSGWDSSKVANASYMFADDVSVVCLDATSFSTSEIKNMKGMFSGMSSLTSLNVNNFSTEKVTDMSEMFKNDTALTTLDLSSFTVNAVANSTDNTSSAATASPTPTSTASNESTIITDMFTGSSLSKIYVSANWKADIAANRRIIRVYATWFYQNLLMAKKTELKDISFTYNLTPGSPMDATSTSSEILQGLLNENCSVTTAHFTSADSSVNGTPSDPDMQERKYMTKKVKVIIDTTQLKAPGIYRYIINETTPLGGVDADLFQLDIYKERVLDILAVYDDNSQITVSSAVMHKEPIALQGQTLAATDKSTQFDNQYLLTTADLVIRNDVSGNQSDLRHEFNYTFKLDGDVAGRQLTVVHSDGSVEYLNIDANMHGELTITLKGKERITIRNIKKGAKYVIKSDKDKLVTQGYEVKVLTSNPKTDYSQYVVLSADTDSTCYVENINVSEDVDISFLNIKNGIVPTGILLDTSPYTLSVILGSAGIFLIHRKHKREKWRDAV